jgi:hypothetical protein
MSIISFGVAVTFARPESKNSYCDLDPFWRKLRSLEDLGLAHLVGHPGAMCGASNPNRATT